MSIETEGFPSDAPETVTKRVQAKPFGYDAQQALLLKEEALRTLPRQECFERGFLTVKDLDDEELVRGRCRDETGHIPRGNSKKTTMIPQHLYDEMVAEHELRYKQKLREKLDSALDVMTDIMEDDTVEPRDRFEAAKYIFERTAGRTAETVNVNVKAAPWEEMLTSVTGIGAISRADHRRLKEEAGHGPGIIDVEVVDEDAVQPGELPQGSETAAEQAVVQVHQPRPDEHAQPDVVRSSGSTTPSQAKPPTFVGQEPTYRLDPAKPDGRPEDWAPVEVNDPDPYVSYGSRRTERRTYADQARDAAALAERRKARREAVQNAKKQRKIARATGADAIEDEITGASLGEDGKLTFE